MTPHARILVIVIVAIQVLSAVVSFHGVPSLRLNTLFEKSLKSHQSNLDSYESNLFHIGSGGNHFSERGSLVTLHSSTGSSPFPELIDDDNNNKASGNAGFKRWQAQLTLLTVSALYGTNFGCVKILGDAMDPSVAAFLRFSLAAMVFSPFVLKFLRSKDNLPMLMGGFEVGTYAAIGYYGQSQSLLTTSASTAAFICSLAVIVVPILNLIFKSPSEKQSSNTVSSPRWYEPLFPALLATVGVGCLELGGSELPGVGDLWAFTQPLFFGLAFWRVEKHMQNKDKTSHVEGSAQAFTGAMMSAVAFFAFFWSIHDFVGPLVEQATLSATGMTSLLPLLQNAVNQQGALIAGDWHILAALFWTGIFTTALTSFGENVAMEELSAAESTIIYSTEPLWGTAFASLALGEAVGWNTFVGAILILGACLWSSLGPSISLAASMGSMQAAIGEGLEEVSNNFNLNMMNLSEINDVTP